MKDKLGVVRILAVLSEEPLTFAQIKERAELSNGTTQRRLEELVDEGIVVVQSEIRDGKEVEIYGVPRQELCKSAKDVAYGIYAL